MMANLLIDQFGPERPGAVMLDPGASSFLAGYQLAYVSHLEFIGYPIDQIQFSRCAKDLWFGGDHSGRSTWSGIPIFLNNKYGVADCFLLPGHTPMLLGRPVMELPGIQLDFANKQIRLPGGHWCRLECGRQDEYLLSLTDSMTWSLVPSRFFGLGQKKKF